MLSKNGDELAAKRFFKKAIAHSGQPEKITIDKSYANNATLKSINNGLMPLEQIDIRKIKYLNNIGEQDHRFVKPIMGFKEFQSEHATLIGSELHHMLCKNQYNNAANLTVSEQFYALAA